MTLDDPPLAAATYARGFAGLRREAEAEPQKRVLALVSRQAPGRSRRRAIASSSETIPTAVVSRRYQLLVNGFAVSVPYESSPEPARYGHRGARLPEPLVHLDLNRGPSVIGAPQFSALTGARGDGVKVAVVDDGVDQEHPFLDPTGFSYPAWLPEGRRAEGRHPR